MIGFSQGQYLEESYNSWFRPGYIRKRTSDKCPIMLLSVAEQKAIDGRSMKVVSRLLLKSKPNSIPTSSAPSGLRQSILREAFAGRLVPDMSGG